MSNPSEESSAPVVLGPQWMRSPAASPKTGHKVKPDMIEIQEDALAGFGSASPSSGVHSGFDNDDENAAPVGKGIYSKDQLLALFDASKCSPPSNAAAPASVISTEVLPPVATLPLTDTEKKYRYDPIFNFRQYNAGGRGKGRGRGRGGFREDPSARGNGGASRGKPTATPAKGVPGGAVADAAAARDSAAASGSQAQDANASGGRPAAAPKQDDAADPNKDKWFYIDPKGGVQGPFSTDQMRVWYEAGYFQQNLPVKRGDSQSFTSLGPLIASGKAAFATRAAAAAAAAPPDQSSAPVAKAESSTAQASNASAAPARTQQESKPATAPATQAAPAASVGRGGGRGSGKAAALPSWTQGGSQQSQQPGGMASSKANAAPAATTSTTGNAGRGSGGKPPTGPAWGASQSEPKQQKTDLREIQEAEARERAKQIESEPKASSQPAHPKSSGQLNSTGDFSPLVPNRGSSSWGAVVAGTASPASMAKIQSEQQRHTEQRQSQQQAQTASPGTPTLSEILAGKDMRRIHIDATVSPTVSGKQGPAGKASAGDSIWPTLGDSSSTTQGARSAASNKKGGEAKISLRDIQQEELSRLSKQQPSDNGSGDSTSAQYRRANPPLERPGWVQQSQPAAPAGRGRGRGGGMSLVELQREEEKRKAERQRTLDAQAAARREKVKAEALAQAQASGAWTTAGQRVQSLAEIQQAELQARATQVQQAERQVAAAAPAETQFGSAWGGKPSAPPPSAGRGGGGPGASQRTGGVSLREIQAAEAAAAERAQERDPISASVLAKPSGQAAKGSAPPPAASADVDQDDDEDFWEVQPTRKQKRAKQQQQQQQQQQQPAAQRAPSAAGGKGGAKSVAPEIPPSPVVTSKGSTPLPFGGVRPTAEFEGWVKDRLRAITDSDDLTLMYFLLSLQSAQETKEYMFQYLGDSPHVVKFADEFVRRKTKLADSWSTVPARRSPATQHKQGDPTLARQQQQQQGGKSKKKKKGGKVDASMLGFTTPAPPPMAED